MSLEYFHSCVPYRQLSIQCLGGFCFGVGGVQAVLMELITCAEFSALAAPGASGVSVPVDKHPSIVQEPSQGRAASPWMSCGDSCVEHRDIG